MRRSFYQSEGPILVKRAKSKKKNDEESQKIIQIIKDEYRQLVEILKKGSEGRQQIFEIQMLKVQNESRKLASTEYEEENKILLNDLDYISDPTLCILFLFFGLEQLIILQKKKKGGQQQGEESQNTSGSLGEYFDNLGGIGKDLSETLYLCCSNANLLIIKFVNFDFLMNNLNLLLK